MLRSRPLPANVVLADLAIEADALQHVGNVVDASLLYVESLYGLV